MVIQTENMVTSNLEMYSLPVPQVLSGWKEQQTMGPESIVYVPIDDTQWDHLDILITLQELPLLM